MQNKKKQWFYIAIIVISLGVAGWLVFGTLSGGETGPTDFISQHQSSTNGLDDPGIAGEILPYGSSFDFSFFSKESFLELIEQPRLQVLPQELGKPNAFIP